VDEAIKAESIFSSCSTYNKLVKGTHGKDCWVITL